MIARGQLLALLVVLGFGCAREVSFLPDARPAVDMLAPDAAVDRDPADTTSPDTSSDASPDTTPDASPDAPSLPKLNCGPATPVGSEPPKTVSDPALRADGLAIYGRPSTEEPRLVARRSDLGSPFGDWEQDLPLPVESGDSTYFMFDGQERAIFSVAVQIDPYLRELRYCSALPATACEKITVVDSASKPITQDMDGPSVRLVNGTLVMVFNVSTYNLSGSANVFQATLTGNDPRHWTAAPLLPFSLPNFAEDDPAMSADGKIVAATLYGSSNDLWVAYRDSFTSPLSAPEPLDVVNTAASEAAVEIFQLGAGEIELYFTTQQPGDVYRRIYRSHCVY